MKLTITFIYIYAHNYCFLRETQIPFRSKDTGFVWDRQGIVFRSHAKIIVIVIVMIGLYSQPPSLIHRFVQAEKATSQRRKSEGRAKAPATTYGDRRSLLMT